MNKDQYTDFEQRIDFFYPHCPMSYADRDECAEEVAKRYLNGS